MKLNTRLGDQLTVKAWGMEAREAVEQLAEAIKGGLGDDIAASQDSATPAMDAEPPLMGAPKQRRGVLQGVTASPGLVIGHLVQASSAETVLEPHQGRDPKFEQTQLNNAIAQARSELNTLIRRLTREERQEQAGIFSAHQEILGDPAIARVAEKTDPGRPLCCLCLAYSHRQRGPGAAKDSTMRSWPSGHRIFAMSAAGCGRC